MLTFQILFIIFLVYITVSHVLSTMFTWRAFRKYKDIIITENPTETVDVISPAYNEEKSIISCVSSTLNQTYDHSNIIVVNDGSTDKTFHLLKQYFNLIEIDLNSVEWGSDLEFQKVHSVWKTEDGRLTVINKENGGKYDALNCGMSYSSADYILSVDADTYLDEAAITDIMTRKREDSTAVSVAIGVINECDVQSHQLSKLRVPNKFLIISQMIEYMRNFVTLRTSTDDLNGVMVISGACGLMNRQYVIDIGGYSDSIVEDANLTLRIQESGGRIQFISKILAYTEVPETVGELHNQRMRWIRGMLTELWSFRFLIRSRTFLGSFMIPYSIFTDVLGVWIELLALTIFAISLYLGLINWPIFILVLAYVFTLYFMSLFSLYYVSMKRLDGLEQYDGKLKAGIVGIFEFLWYRILLAGFVIKSQFLELFKYKKNWGKLKRRGF